MRTPLGLALACIAMIALSYGCEAKQEEAAGSGAPNTANKQTAPKTPEKSPQDLAADWAGTVCGDYRVCYTEFEWNGAFDGTIEAEVSPDGTVVSASYTGSAPPPLQSCLTDRVKAKKLDGYQPHEGKFLSAKCTFSGQLTGGAVMEMVDWRGSWVDAPTAPAPAETAPTEAAPAEAVPAEADPKVAPGKLPGDTIPDNVGETEDPAATE